MPCPPSLLSGTITSAASCQVIATYASPGFIVAAVFCPRGLSKANSTSAMSCQSGSPFRRSAGKSLGEVIGTVLDREPPMQRLDTLDKRTLQKARDLLNT